MASVSYQNQYLVVPAGLLSDKMMVTIPTQSTAIMALCKITLNAYCRNTAPKGGRALVSASRPMLLKDCTMKDSKNSEITP
jgi:hypothetical protein